MEAHPYRTIESLLASTKPEELRQGLELVKKEISKVGTEEARPLFEMVSTIFYIDPLDRPDLAPLLDEAVTLVVGFGRWVIPVLLQDLEFGDLKAQLAVAHALGRMGADAIAPLLDEYESTSDLACRSFVVYALGKIKSPKVVKAAHLVLRAARSTERELRDTGTRAIGKLVESIPPSDLPAETRRDFFEALQLNIADQSPSIRAKAVRSLGKLAKYGHLTAPEREVLTSSLNRLLGRDERFEWDRAYLVRKEAEEALHYVT